MTLHQKEMQEENRVFANNKMLARVRSFLTTVTDSINAFFFGTTAPVASATTYNTTISNKMTSLFTNTRINVYVYDSKVPNAFAMPGVAVRNPYVIKLYSSIHFIPVIGGVLSKIFMLFLDIMKVGTLLTADGANGRLDYDPNTGKFTMSLKEVTIYIASSAIVLLENDDEVIAFLLHEVGHNTMILLNILSEFSHVTLGGFTLGALFNRLYLAYQYPGYDPYWQNNDDNTIASSLRSIATDGSDFALLKIILVCYAISYALSYLSRRQEVYADEFAIKCGYGEQLEKAIKKLHKYYGRFNVFSATKFSLQIIDKVIFILAKFSFEVGNRVHALFGLHNYPSRWRREKLISQKTKQFDNSLIDRSDHIDKNTLLI